MPSDDRLPVTYTMPPPALQSAASAEEWVNSLPPDARATFVSQAQVVLAGLPPALKIALARYLVQVKQPIPAVLGVGTLGDAAPSASGSGAGIGAAIGALIGAGAGLYSNHETIQANNAINASANATDINIANINANAQVAINQAFATAQGQAAAYHAQTAVSTIPTIAKWGAIGAVGIAALGIGAWFLIHRKK